MEDKGFLFIATGNEYLEEAKESAKSIRQYSDKPIAIVTDKQVENKYFDKVIIDEEPTFSFFDKPRNLVKTPFDKTVFIDTDVHIINPIPELFAVLDEADIATTIDPNEWGGKMQRDPHYKKIPESVPIFQTGVICYRTNKSTESFFKTWTKIHRKNRDTLCTDQSSFRLAIYQSNINHLVMSDLYNCLGTWPMQITGEVKVIHKGADNKKEAEKLASRMNTTQQPRLFYAPLKGNIHSPLHPYINIIIFPLSNIINSIYRVSSYYRKNGMIKTINRGLRKMLSD